MQYVCENENEDVLRLLVFDNTVKDLILEIGPSTSSFAKLRSEGFRIKEIQELLEIGAINIENDHWLKDCVSKGDCAFLYFTAPLRLSEKGLAVFNRLSHHLCYCLWNINYIWHRRHRAKRSITRESVNHKDSCIRNWFF
jgi:hypothetical protein